MKCSRRGCPNTFKGARYLAYTVDERKLSPGNSRYHKDYPGFDWEWWCGDCHATLSADKYALVYYAEGNKIKQKRTSLPEKLPPRPDKSVFTTLENPRGLGTPVAEQIPVVSAPSPAKKKPAVAPVVEAE